MVLLLYCTLLFNITLKRNSYTRKNDTHFMDIASLNYFLNTLSRLLRHLFMPLEH